MATEFTPGAGLVGGLLIGLASVGLLLADGRIAGISGILGRSFSTTRGDRSWRVAFLIGLPIGAWITALVAPATSAFDVTHSAPLLVAGGLLVGVGTQLGNGCTSGHGVCGIARGSRRSIVATATFMLAGFATVYVARHLLGAS